MPMIHERITERWIEEPEQDDSQSQDLEYEDEGETAEVQEAPLSEIPEAPEPLGALEPPSARRKQRK